MSDPPDPKIGRVSKCKGHEYALKRVNQYKIGRHGSARASPGHGATVRGPPRRRLSRERRLDTALREATRYCRSAGRTADSQACHRGRRAGARIQRRRRGADRGGPAYAGQRRSDYDRALISVTPSPPPDQQRIQVRVGGRRQRRAGGAADGDAPRCLVRPRRLTVIQTGRMGRRLGDTNADRHQRPGPQIRVGHLNVNRLMPSIDDVNLILQDQNLDILCLTRAP